MTKPQLAALKFLLECERHRAISGSRYKEADSHIAALDDGEGRNDPPPPPPSGQPPGN